MLRLLSKLGSILLGAALLQIRGNDRTGQHSQKHQDQCRLFVGHINAPFSE
jgi:hypothetical protein